MHLVVAEPEAGVEEYDEEEEEEEEEEGHISAQQLFGRDGQLGCWVRGSLGQGVCWVRGSVGLLEERVSWVVGSVGSEGQLSC